MKSRRDFFKTVVGAAVAAVSPVAPPVATALVSFRLPNLNGDIYFAPYIPLLVTPSISGHKLSHEHFTSPLRCTNALNSYVVPTKFSRA